jgi:hypothetical protein
MASMLGSYDNIDLGRIMLVQKENEYFLDAGETKSKLARYERPDGTPVLMTTDGALVGLELIPRDDGTFLISYGQEKYVLKPAAR